VTTSERRQLHPPRVAVFRPADERIEDAKALLASLGADPVADPMLAVEPTGRDARGCAVRRPHEQDGRRTRRRGGAGSPATRPSSPSALRPPRRAARAAGWTVDLVPDEYTSAGLVAALEDRVDGEHVEVARSDHGSDVLLAGLREAGATVTETVLYRLTRPSDAGESAAMAAAGDLDAAAFTSSLTVTHFLDAAAERGSARRRSKG